jgi:hypothetical protein
MALQAVMFFSARIFWETASPAAMSSTVVIAISVLGYPNGLWPNIVRAAGMTHHYGTLPVSANSHL